MIAQIDISIHKQKIIERISYLEFVKYQLFIRNLNAFKEFIVNCIFDKSRSQSNKNSYRFETSHSDFRTICKLSMPTGKHSLPVTA